MCLPRRISRTAAFENAKGFLGRFKAYDFAAVAERAENAPEFAMMRSNVDNAINIEYFEQ
jgi:hypothetical protein